MSLASPSPSTLAAAAAAVDIATGDAVAADDDDAVNAVVPPSATKDENAYIGALVAFEGACVGPFAEDAAAVDVVLSRCRQIKIFHTLSPVPYSSINLSS